MFLSTSLVFIRFTMFAKREVLVSMLKLTKEGTTELESISQEAHVPVQIVREVLRKHVNLVTYAPSSRSVSINSEQRLKLVMKIVELGADIERVCDSLTWLEFEDVSIITFEANNYKTKKHFRFTWANRRWEIDILALKEPLIVCADCKHWHQGWSGSGSRRAADMQAERTKNLYEVSKSINDKIGMGNWKHVHFVPMILSLVPGNQKFYKGVPIVPVLQLGDFLTSMPAYLDQILHF
jgi:hypothetical protein